MVYFRSSETSMLWWKYGSWGMEEWPTNGLKNLLKLAYIGNGQKIRNVHYLNRFIRNFVFDFLMFLGVFEVPNAISNHVLWKKSDPNLENDKSKCFWNFALMRFSRKVTKTESITSNIGKGALFKFNVCWDTPLHSSEAVLLQKTENLNFV